MSWEYKSDKTGLRLVQVFELSPGEARTIKPLIEKRLKVARKKLEYYTDIHYGGEATPHEETLRYKWEEGVGLLEGILKRI